MNYNEKYLYVGLRKVKSGEMSIRKASECYAVPYTALQRWSKEGQKLLQYGRQPVLNQNEENCLVECLILCANWGFALQSLGITAIVQQYLNKKGVIEKRFKYNRPGVEWFHCFMKRHPELTAKFSQNIKSSRAA
ncbi:hypothetical protein ANN_27838 [Periplaneta americana]|uniref:HTH psq-type domain-containing protein n=1 Tax=Periplaneta americana TaxID=6978 RepID=A0ABQ8RVK3_PERAM|nr:hypothetical protein ANN_27838 [Periplaneta americana]